MRLKPIELTEDSTLEDIAKEVYQCWIQNESTREAYAHGHANYAELNGTEIDLNEAMDKLRIKLYKP
jgi:hypothetical protein